MTYVSRCCLRLCGLMLGASLASQGIAQDSTLDRDWNYLAEIYLWGPDIDLETADGTHQEIKFSDLVDVTKGGFKGGFYVQRDKWQKN